MADPVIPAADPAPAAAAPAPEPAPAAPVAAAPVVEAPKPEPVVAEPPKPAAEAAEAAPAAPEPLKPEAAKPEPPKHHSEKPTLLAEAGKDPKDAKPGEPPKPEGEQPVSTEPPKYEFKTPDFIKIEPKEIEEISAFLGEHKIAPEVAQPLLDRHFAELKKYADTLAVQQNRAWEDLRASWVKEVLADPQLGGSGHKTAMGAIARARDALIPASDQADFAKLDALTGVGDHPAFLRILHRAARMFDEPQASSAVTGKPAATNGVDPSAKKGLRGIYARNAEARASGTS